MTHIPNNFVDIQVPEWDVKPAETGKTEKRLTEKLQICTWYKIITELSLGGTGQ